MIWLGILDHTLTLGGYWDYNPFIDDRLWPLRDGEPHSFLYSGEERV
jgi:hypothetical protein